MPAITTPNATVALTGVSAAQLPALTGPIVHRASFPVTMAGSAADFATTLNTSIIRSNLTGLLDFYYLLTPPPPAHNANTFQPFKINFWQPNTQFSCADFRTDTIGGYFAPKLFLCYAAYGYCAFSFINPAVGPGIQLVGNAHSSCWFFVSTNASQFLTSGGTLQSGSQVLTIPGPLPPIGPPPGPTHQTGHH
jgi:hypothetical protein